MPFGTPLGCATRGVGGGDVPSLFRSLRVMCGRDCESSAASNKRTQQHLSDAPSLPTHKDKDKKRERESENAARTTDSPLSVLFISRSPPPLLDALEEPLAYPIPTALPFLFNAFALKLVGRLCTLERIPLFHRQLREQCRALEGEWVQAKRI